MSSSLSTISGRNKNPHNRRSERNSGDSAQGSAQSSAGSTSQSVLPTAAQPPTTSEEEAGTGGISENGEETDQTESDQQPEDGGEEEGGGGGGGGGGGEEEENGDEDGKSEESEREDSREVDDEISSTTPMQTVVITDIAITEPMTTSEIITALTENQTTESPYCEIPPLSPVRYETEMDACVLRNGLELMNCPCPMKTLICPELPILPEVKFTESNQVTLGVNNAIEIRSGRQNKTHQVKNGCNRPYNRYIAMTVMVTSAVVSYYLI
ncbi:hypothetical protein BSL78_14538 [Apostichopus japonicus]|uniref:Uncharacterized protein n=1 Tax=Stichopus japonicus TaxID=307972 RepID=A0A2G8KKW0_STIJA|nr:hypothetical protein BSL78_14538 [Apostichopus japonicus]